MSLAKRRALRTLYRVRDRRKEGTEPLARVPLPFFFGRSLMTIKTLFDGEKIHLPKELAGHEPCEIEITFVDPILKPKPESFWSVVARANGTRSSQEIIDEVSRDRDSWERK